MASALTENEISAPVIHKTTRPSCGVATLSSWVCREGGVLYQPAAAVSLGVGLVFRPRLVEGRQV